MMEFFSQAFTTLLVAIDPFAVVPVFIILTAQMNQENRRKVALRATLVALLILLSFAFLGDKLLDNLGISEPAFRIAGGFLLLLTAINMVTSHQNTLPAREGQDKSDKSHTDVSVFPLAIPIISGPGAMASIVVLMRKAELIGVAAISGLMGILIAVILIVMVTLLFAERCARLLGFTGLNVLTRVFGIILAALAVQFMANGTVMLIKMYF